MTRYTHTHIRYLADNAAPVVTNVPWNREDFAQAIRDVESDITARRLRDALLSEAGRQWLAAKEAEIDVLRMAQSELAE